MFTVKVIQWVRSQNNNVSNITKFMFYFSKGRVLTKQFLVPLLLGLKFNVVTLLPIIFGIIVLISKKAIFLIKILIFLSNLFGFGGFGGSFGGLGGAASSPFFPQQFGGAGQYPYKQHSLSNSYQDDGLSELDDSFYKIKDNFEPGDESHRDDRFYDYDKEVYKPNDIKFTRDPRYTSSAYQNIVWKTDSVK